MTNDKLIKILARIIYTFNLDNRGEDIIGILNMSGAFYDLSSAEIVILATEIEQLSHEISEIKSHLIMRNNKWGI